MYLAFRWHAIIIPQSGTTSKSWTNLETSSQSPDKNSTLWPKLIFQICTKLLSTCFSSSTSTTVTTSTSFVLVSSHARVTSIKFTKQEWVSHGQVMPMIGLGSDKNISANSLILILQLPNEMCWDKWLYDKLTVKCFSYWRQTREKMQYIY